MAAAITASPTSGTATKTVFRITVTGLDDTDIGTYDSTPTPPAFAETAFSYYMIGHEGGNVKLRSHGFNVSQDGTHTWYDVVVPDAGSWSFQVRKSTGETLASVGVTVS